MAAAFALAAVPARADQWSDAVQAGSIVYLPIYADAARIDRYDLDARAWLPSIPIPFRAVDIAIAPNAIYVQGLSRLTRITHGGTEIWSIPSNSPEIEVDPAGWLFAIDPPTNRLLVFDAADGSVHDAENLSAASSDTHLIDGLSLAPGIRRAFVQWRRASDHRIGAVSYGADGSLGPFVRSATLSDSIEGAQRTWVFPGEDLVTDGHGLVLDAETLAWRGSLLGSADHLAFDGDAPIRSRIVWFTRHGADLEPLGDAEFDEPGALFAHEGLLFRFYNSWANAPDPSAIVAISPIDAIAWPPLAEPGPFDASWGPPDAFHVDEAGILSLFRFEGTGPTLRRWSIADQEAVEAIPLRPSVDRYFDCPALDGVLVNRGGELRLLPHGASTDVRWLNLWAPAMTCTDRHVVFVLRSPGSGSRIATYTAGGVPAHFVDLPLIHSPHVMWSGSQGLLFLSSELGTPRLASFAIDASGQIAPVEDAPAETPVPWDHAALRAPDGPLLIRGNYLYDSDSLARGSYIERAQSAFWHDGRLFVLRGYTADESLDVYDSAGQRIESTPLPFAYAIFDHGDALRAAVWRFGVFSVRTIAFDDIDGDGFPSSTDAFPGDPDEWNDRDGDGSGDNGDVYPDDASEWLDNDGDGVGNNTDAFDHDPLEWSDRDGDGLGDNGDPFPDDGSEWNDTDGDGVGDNGDWAPQDPAECLDSDGDGIGDNADHFPLDPSEQRDFDGDGVGDHGDPFPIGDPFVGLVDLAGSERAVFSKLGFVRRSHPGGNLGLLPDGSVSLCDRGGCVFGRHRLADTVGRRFAIDFDPEFVALMETRLEQGLDDALDNAFRRNVILDLVLRPDESRTLVKIDRDGKRGVLKAKWVFDAYIENAPGPYRHLRFAWVWKLQRAEVVRP